MTKWLSRFSCGNEVLLGAYCWNRLIQPSKLATAVHVLKLRGPSDTTVLEHCRYHGRGSGSRLLYTRDHFSCPCVRLVPQSSALLCRRKQRHHQRHRRVPSSSSVDVSHGTTEHRPP